MNNATYYNSPVINNMFVLHNVPFYETDCQVLVQLTFLSVVAWWTEL